jgi:hypothetical protein
MLASVVIGGHLLACDATKAYSETAVCRRQRNPLAKSDKPLDGAAACFHDSQDKSINYSLITGRGASCWALP